MVEPGEQAESCRIPMLGVGNPEPAVVLAG